MIGGDVRSCNLALHLAARGGRVTVVEPRPALAHDADAATGARLVSRVEATPEIDVILDATLERSRSRTAEIQRQGEVVRLAPIDVVIAGEVVVADNGLYEALVADDSIPFDVRAIGDCVSPRDIFAATQASAELVQSLRRH